VNSHRLARNVLLERLLELRSGGNESIPYYYVYLAVFADVGYQKKLTEYYVLNGM
jgi:hypothetical protein